MLEMRHECTFLFYAMCEVVLDPCLSHAYDHIPGATFVERTAVYPANDGPLEMVIRQPNPAAKQVLCTPPGSVMCQHSLDSWANAGEKLVRYGPDRRSHLVDRHL
jgi:hypothetical protein